MRYHFIYNPRAGSTRISLHSTIQSFITQHGLDATITETTESGHATELAQAAVAAGVDIVVAVGGDGTINEVARALVGTPAILGLVPRGSGNGLARDLGVSLRLKQSLAGLLTGKPRLIDSGTANGHPFFCAMGTGFDSAVVSRFNALPRRGFFAYLTAAIIEMVVYRSRPVEISPAGMPTLAARPLFICVANAAQLGNNAFIAPHARVDDGRLNLVVVPDLNPFIALPLVWRLFRRTLDRSPRVVSATNTRFVITRDRPGSMHTDGELVETEAVIDVQIRPASLRVLCP